MTKAEYSLGDLVEVDIFVHKGYPNIRKAKAIFSYDIERDCFYWYVVDARVPYLGFCELFDIRECHNIIKTSDDSKRLLIVRAKYLEIKDSLESRWSNDKRELLSIIWKKINKNKKHLLHRLTKEFIKSFWKWEEKGGRDARDKKYYQEVGCWVINYTKSKKIKADDIMGCEGILRSVNDIIGEKPTREDELVNLKEEG